MDSKESDVMIDIYNIEEIQELINRNEIKPLYFTPAYQSYYSAGDESEILCPSCRCNLDDYDIENKEFRFCPKCGQKLMSVEETRNNAQNIKSIKKGGV